MLFTTSDVAPGVNANKIQRVRLGMTPKEVESALGRPFTINTYKGSMAHNLSCPNPDEARRSIAVTAATDIGQFFRQIAADTAVHACHRDDEFRHERKTTFTYSRRCPGVLRTYPMLWVHFNKQGQVDNVYAKEYDFYDDVCIYSLSGDEYDVANQEALNRLFGTEQ